MDYHFGFSWRGLIVFLLPMVPNLFYFLIPASIDSGNKGNSHFLLDILEHGSQAIFIFLLIFVIRNQASQMLFPYLIGMGVLLFFYYVLWMLYFTGNASLFILLGMAVLPVIYFILAEIWLHHYLAILPTTLFGIIHVIITYMDYQSRV